MMLVLVDGCPEDTEDGGPASSALTTPDSASSKSSIPHGSEYTVSAFCCSFSLVKGRYPRHLSSSVMSMASRRCLGSVISILNDDAATVAAELRLAIDPI